MAHDLRAINNNVLETTQVVPNPTTVIAMLTPEQQWFTVNDLAKAFFCLPLHKSLQPIFAFTFSGQQYTFTLMSQGFFLTQGIFNTILRQLLQNSPALPENTLLYSICGRSAHCSPHLRNLHISTHPPGQERHICENAAHSLQFSFQHHNTRTIYLLTGQTGSQHLPLQLAAGLPQPEATISACWKPHHPQHHPEQRGPVRLRAQSSALHPADTRQHHPTVPTIF